MWIQTEIKHSDSVLALSLTAELLLHCEKNAPIDNSSGCNIFNHQNRAALWQEIITSIIPAWDSFDCKRSNKTASGTKESIVLLKEKLEIFTLGYLKYSKSFVDFINDEWGCFLSSCKLVVFETQANETHMYKTEI